MRNNILCMNTTILRAKRREQGMTLEQAAKKIGINFATLSRIERGQQNPSPRVAMRIGKLYGIDLNVVYAHIR